MIRPGPATTQPSRRGRLAANGTRLWVYCGNGTPTDPALASPDAPIGGLGFLEGMATDSNHAFADAYIGGGRQQRRVQLPGRHPRLGVTAGQQLQQMKPDHASGCSARRRQPGVSWWRAAERTVSEEIPAPPDEVRDFYVDLDNIKQVHPLVVAVRRTDRQQTANRHVQSYRRPGPNSVGAVAVTDQLRGTACMCRTSATSTAEAASVPAGSAAHEGDVRA